MSPVSATEPLLEHRVARFKVTMDPQVLWPDLSQDALRAGLRAVTHATRDVLSDRPTPLRSTDAGVSPRTLGVAAFISGMGPLLGYWITEGRLPAGREEAALLRRHLEYGCQRHALLQERLAALLDALQAHRITPIVLKGMDTSIRYLPAPGTRTIGDIDLLVRPEEIDQARAVLAGRGFLEKPNSGQPVRSEWAPPVAPPIQSVEIDHPDNPWAVDLHAALDRYYHRGLSASLGAWAFDTTVCEVAGRPARVMAQPALTAWLAIHATYSLRHLQLARLVELVFVIRKDAAQGALSWDALLAVLRESGTTRFAYPALALVEHLAPGTVPPAVVRHAAAASTRRAQRVVAALAASGMYRLERHSLDDTLMWAHGPLQLLLAISDVVWPTGQTDPAAVGRLYLRRLRAAIRGRLTLRAHPH